MRRANFAKTMKNLQRAVNCHSPEILTGLGIAGMISTVILAVRVTPKALSVIKEDSVNRHEDPDAYTPVEAIKSAYKYYVPAVIVCVSSMGCILGANSVSLRRNAALATAYKLSETAFLEYKDKVVETLGEKKEQTIHDKIAKEHVDNNPVSKNEIVIMNNESTLCYDLYSGRYFKSSMEKIKRAEIHINKTLINEMSASLNDFYDEIGLPHSKLGEELGWSSSYGFLEITYSSQLCDNGSPCLTIDYSIAPFHGYSSCM